MKKHILMPKWLVIFFPKKFAAITISKNTALYRNSQSLDRTDLRVHEEVHMDQYKKYTWIGFVVLYTYYSIKYGYWNNPLEIEAREKTQETLDRIQGF